MWDLALEKTDNFLLKTLKTLKTIDAHLPLLTTDKIWVFVFHHSILLSSLLLSLSLNHLPPLFNHILFLFPSWHIDWCLSRALYDNGTWERKQIKVSYPRLCHLAPQQMLQQEIFYDCAYSLRLQFDVFSNLSLQPIIVSVMLQKIKYRREKGGYILQYKKGDIRFLCILI